MGKILKFPSKRVLPKSKKIDPSTTDGGEKEYSQVGELIALQDYKSRRMPMERRAAQRVVLNQSVAAYIFVNTLGLIPTQIVNIHEKGLSFEFDSKFGSFYRGEEVHIRFYLNHEAYFKIPVRIAYSSEDETRGVTRHGASFLKDSETKDTLQYFVKFLQSLELSIKTDRGERVVGHLIS